MTQNQSLPAPTYPLVDKDGKISPIWYQYLQSLWIRTGGGSPQGNVSSITVNTADGIISTTENNTSNAVINLSLGGITPSSVNSSGAVIANTGAFANGLSCGANMSFGVYTAATPTANGYVTITDVNGISRRLMVG